MSTQKIIITFFIVFLSLFFIVNSTYTFVESKISNTLNIQKESGIYPLTSSGVEKKIALGATIPDGENFVDVVNYTDSVYGKGKGYSKTISGNNINFSLKDSGIFLFDLLDISNNYTISSTGFKLKVKTPGKIFVDTRTSQIKIFSFDAVVDISLLVDQKEMTTLALHPKMFFAFNLSRNIRLANADLLRLETLTNIFYFSSPVLSKDFKVSPALVRKFGYLGDADVSDFLNLTFAQMYSPKEIKRYSEEKIKENLIPVKAMGGIDYIDEYFLLFLNDQKKIAYYKKRIIGNLNRGFDKKNVLNMAEIETDLEKFKELSPEEYKKFLPVLYYYYVNYLKVNSLDYIKNTIILSDLLMDINGNKKKVSKSYFYLSKMYALLNNGSFSNSDLQTNFLEFLKTFLNEKNISMNGDSYFFKIKDTKMTGELEYLGLFIKNILLNDVTFEDTSKLSNILHVFKVYETLSENINSIKNNTKSETFIIENNLIIEKILKEMRKNLFEPNLNEKGLLVTKQDENITVDLVSNLHSAVTSFFKFYSAKKGSLSEKNQIYNDTYQKNYNTYSEYYIALSNYPEYLLKYDKTAKELFDTKTILETQKAVELNEENLLAYLQKFVGVDTAGMKYTIENNEYYTISNLNINGEIFSFNLYPKDGNKMTQIYRNGTKLPLTYNLDEIKQTWDLEFEDADDEKKDQYNFANFFINIFNGQTYKENQKFVQEEETLKESKNVRLFKSDKLLGERGEFSILKGFLELKYNNIIVTEKPNSFDINIDDIFFTTNIKMGSEDIPVIGEISAQYVFNQTDHYFKNISLKFYNEQMYTNGGDKVYIFDGKSFPVSENINIVDFKNEINSIIEKIFTTNN